MIYLKQTKLLALTGVLSALSVVLMFFGSAIAVFAYIMPLASGILMIVLNSFDKKQSWIMFIVVSMISIFALPDKECPLTYIFFFGYYPIIRDNFDKIKNNVLRYFSKLLAFNSGVVVSQLICFYVFMIPFDDIFGKWGIAILLVLANLVFIVYEKLMSALILLYDKKLKKTISKLIK